MNMSSLFCSLYLCSLLSLSFANSIFSYPRLNSLPETPVAIDWSYYKSSVAKAGMVDEFEKKVNLTQVVDLHIIMVSPRSLGHGHNVIIFYHLFA